ncbi:MAG: hypothetical protein IT289_00350 [Oligoflexia bacterium]|nr:hypothetical protein [Oligoflexia bacterium]
MNRLLKTNQSGFATILAVVVTSMVLVTSLTSIYVYYVNNLRYQVRIKEAYRMMAVMEQAAKVVRSAWDEAAAAEMAARGGTIASLDGDASTTSTADISQYNGLVATRAQVVVDNYTFNPATCVQDPAGLAAICVDVDDSDDLDAGGNPVNPDPSCYCFATGGTSMQAFNWNLPMIERNAEIDNSRFGKFIAKVDRFFDATPAKIKGIDFNNKQSDNLIAAIPKPAFMAWAVSESRALAGYDVNNQHVTQPEVAGNPLFRNEGGPPPIYSPPHTASPTPTPDHPGETAHLDLPNYNCSSGGTNSTQCMSCGSGTGVACVSLFGCPKTFGSFCEDVDPTNISETTAMFRQPFLVTPMGYGSLWK